MTSDLRRPTFSSVAKKLLVPVLLILASIAFVAANAPEHERMSPFDEYVYIDYLAKFPEQGVIHRGELTGDVARSYYSCHGVEIFGKIAPDNCSTNEYDVDGEYPFGGINSADIYTPLYFGATWVTAQPIMWATGTDLVEAGRLAGGAWLGAAAVMLYFALGRLHLSAVARCTAPLLMISSVSAWWSNTYISTDASALLAGSTLLFLSLRYTQTGRGRAALLITSALAVALKLQNFIAVVLAIGFILLSSLKSEVRSQKRAHSGLTTKQRLLTVTGMLILPVLVQLSWMAIRSSIAVGAPADQDTASSLGLPEILREALKFFNTTGNAFPVNSAATIGWALSNVLSWLLVAGVLAAIAVEARWSNRHALAVSWVITALAAGPALAIATRVTEGYYFELPTRYGISLLPAAVALAATLFDRKSETRMLLAGFALITFAVSLTPYYPGAEMLG